VKARIGKVKMNVQNVFVHKKQFDWKELLIKLLVWVTLEICLNLLGIDDLMDCSEFIFEKDYIVFCYYI
jgi:hypothetical protein